MSTEQKIIKNKVGLLNLAEELGNVSRACKSHGLFERHVLPLQQAVDEGGVKVLIDKSRRRPNLGGNRTAPEIEEAIVALAIEEPALGQVRVANQLRQKRGLHISPAGVRGVWMRRPPTFSIASRRSRRRWPRTGSSYRKPGPGARAQREDDESRRDRDTKLKILQEFYRSCSARSCTRTLTNCRRISMLGSFATTTQANASRQDVLRKDASRDVRRRHEDLGGEGDRRSRRLDPHPTDGSATGVTVRSDRDYYI